MTGARVRLFSPSFPGIGGTLPLAMWLAAAISSSAQTFNVLVTFNGTNGDDPEAALVQGTDGNYYGTTFFGGIHVYGTVFKVSPAGELTTLYNFCSTSGCLDGAMPVGGLLLATNGVMYGTTTAGGANKCTVGTQTQGCGTIFQISPGGAFTTLYSFAGSDGSFPVGPLVQGTDGNLYGTTVEGGAADEGTVFMITPGGNLSTLYSFHSSCTSLCAGTYPNALIQGTDGNFYGTTVGGAGSGGTVFSITPQGVLTTLYDLCPPTGCSGALGTYAALVQAANGNFYGVTVGGGNGVTSPSCDQSSGGFGTVFEITPSGTFTNLYNFQNSSDGANPDAALIQATDGNLYGTTACGGSNDAGTTFSITPGGTLTPLVSFASPAGLGAAQAGLLQATNGNFYGTTPADGSGNGTVFSLSVGLEPFVKTLPTSGGVGTVIQILGTGLTGATAVRFNGTAAVFTVVSDLDIQATVPAGATSGIVTVTTANGRLSSNPVFQVTTQVATPVFSLPGGIYPSAQKVTISDTTAGATIYYTTNGTTPTTSSAVYSAPITVASTEMIEAIAIASGYATSPVASAAYGIETPMPTFSLPAGIYASTQTLTISDAMAGATIYYTMGGTATPPNTGSTVYSGPITVSSTATVQAIAVASGYSPSTVTSALYIIGAPFIVEPIAGTPVPVIVSPGATASYTLTLTPNGVPTIPVAVSFSASGLPSGATATFSPNPVSAGAGSTSVGLTIQTSSSSARSAFARMRWAVAFCFLFVPLARMRRLRSRIGRNVHGTGYLLGLLSLCVLSGALTGCRAISAALGTAPSSHVYVITITAAGGGTSATTTVALKVQG